MRWSISGRQLRDSNALLAMRFADAQARLLDEGRRARSRECAGFAIRARAGGGGNASAWQACCANGWTSNGCASRSRWKQLERGKQVARHADLEFAVSIDRVDRLADGARVLIDYKTGNAAADWRGERPDNPQLPIYALLHPEAWSRSPMAGSMPPNAASSRRRNGRKSSSRAASDRRSKA